MITPATEAERRLLDTLDAVIWQSCEEAGSLDSFAISSYADGLLLLAEYGRVRITMQRGRRVIAVSAPRVQA